MVEYYRDELTTTTPPPTTTKELFFFELERPGATILIGAISIVHSLFHLPHCLLYRRLGVLTAFWSLIGAGLVFGAVVEKEFFYDAWIWYSCVYVPVMLITMCVVLTAYIWQMDIRLLRVVIATVGIMFYLFMFYCIVFVNDEKRKIFTTTSAPATNTSTCGTCQTCATSHPPLMMKKLARLRGNKKVPKFVRFYRHLSAATAGAGAGPGRAA